MLKKFAFLGFFIVSFFFHESFIFAAGNACSMPSYLIVHINGINTTKKEARYNALQVLAEAVGSSYKGERVEVAIAYNPTKALLDDLSDVFAQKMKEYPEVGRDLIFKALVNGVVSPLLPLQLKEYTAKYHIGKVESSGFVGYSDEDLGDIVSAIRAKMTENQKILLVPHSQGNLYANAVYARLTSGNNAVPTSAIRIMGMATPAAYVAGNGDYITSANDLVIAGLRSSGLSVLRANYTIGVSMDDVLGHSMADIYLNAEHEGRSEVIRKLHASMEALQFPGGDASRGPITVTLTWGSQPDIDLHVFEPNGIQVYYGKLSGYVGFLDLDDTDGYGPEHYYTDCAKLQTGIYYIGVNYFGGWVPETATVTISTPVSIVTRRLQLYSMRGSEGNASPQIVAIVVVKQTPTGRYTFEIN